MYVRGRIRIPRSPPDFSWPHSSPVRGAKSVFNRSHWKLAFYCVLDALHIADPILVGHSIAGEELSAVSTYYPGRAAALIYLDAGPIHIAPTKKVAPMMTAR